MTTPVNKLRRKGLVESLRILIERYIFYHWELVTVERSFSDLNYRPTNAERWPLVRINRALVPAFERYFPHYQKALDELLGLDVEGYALCNKAGDVVLMMWISDKDYYDHQLYRCWVRLPPGYIYQFAAELAVPYRNGLLLPHFMTQIWDIYRQQGKHAARALVNRNNVATLRMLLRAGAHEVGESIHVYCLFRCLHFHRRRHYSASASRGESLTQAAMADADSVREGH